MSDFWCSPGFTQNYPEFILLLNANFVYVFWFEYAPVITGQRLCILCDFLGDVDACLFISQCRFEWGGGIVEKVKNYGIFRKHKEGSWTTGYRVRMCVGGVCGCGMWCGCVVCVCVVVCVYMMWGVYVYVVCGVCVVCVRVFVGGGLREWKLQDIVIHDAILCVPQLCHHSSTCQWRYWSIILMVRTVSVWGGECVYVRCVVWSSPSSPPSSLPPYPPSSAAIEGVGDVPYFILEPVLQK